MAASDAFYNEIVEEVVPLIEEFGTTYTIRAQEEYDDEELEVIPGSVREVFGLVSEQNIANQQDKMQGWIEGKTLLLVPSANPLPNEEVLVDGKWYPLTNVVILKSADIVVLYTLSLIK